MDYKCSELVKFIDKLRELADDQQREVDKSLVGCGKYFLHSYYSHLEIPQAKLFSMTKEQRRRQVKNLNDMRLSSLNTGGSSSLPTSSASVSEPLTNIPSTAPSVLSVKLSAVANNLGLLNAAIGGIAKKLVKFLTPKEQLSMHLVIPLM